ncbi:MAG: hypothetical protein WAV32_10435 [Halobacteriota archaeon]
MSEKSADAKEKVVKAVLADLALNGGSKERLLAKLVDEYGYDEAKVKYKAKRAFITERYAMAKNSE